MRVLILLLFLHGFKLLTIPELLRRLGTCLILLVSIFINLHFGHTFNHTTRIKLMFHETHTKISQETQHARIKWLIDGTLIGNLIPVYTTSTI